MSLAPPIIEPGVTPLMPTPWLPNKELDAIIQSQGVLSLKRNGSGVRSHLINSRCKTVFERQDLSKD